MPTTDTTTLTQLKEATAKFARERNWEQFHAPKNLSMAILAPQQINNIAVKLESRCRDVEY